MDMSMMTCYCCDTDKPLDAFVKDKYKKSGYKSLCKRCSAAKTRAYHAANLEKSRAKLYAWCEKNKQYLADYHKNRRGTLDTFQPKERVETRTAEEARAHEKERKRQYDIDHTAKNSAYRQANKEHSNAYHRTYRKEREACDPGYRVTARLRSRI